MGKMGGGGEGEDRRGRGGGRGGEGEDGRGRGRGREGGGELFAVWLWNVHF